MTLSNETNSRYTAFISYNHRDAKFAKKLHQKLENYSFSETKIGQEKRTLFPIFIDNSELKAGITLSDAIQDAIKSSQYLIVICSENSITSQWVKAEIALMKEIHGVSKIIGVIPDANGDESHIAQLLDGNTQHLAADFRPGKNKYLQLSKIAATLADVELDELYQRANRRKNKQMTAFGVGLTAIATLMTGLAADAYFSEKEVVRQRQKSEEVIAFMIDEFRGDLETLDKLDLLTDVGKKAQEYFDDRELGLLSDDSILLQSRTLRQLSDVNEKRGEIATAIIRIQSAHAASQLMLKRRPDDKNTITEHAENTDLWGYLEYQMGNLEKAKTLFESAKITHARGAEYFPDDRAIAWNHTTADLNIGIMILQQGLADEARPYLERTLLTVQKQYDANKLNEEELYEYAGMYTWYIRSLPDDTPVKFLLETRKKQLALFEDMRKSGARTIRNQAEKLNVERAYVILLLHSGKDDEARALMRSIQNEFKTLLEHDPENVGWRRHLMRSKLTLGLLHDKYDRKNDRNRELQEVIKLGEKPNGEQWGLTSDIDRRMNRLMAYQLYDEVSLDAALESLTIAENKIEDYWKGEFNPRVRYNLSSLLSFKAELLTREGRVSDAQTEQRRVLDLLSQKDSFSIAEQKLLLMAHMQLNMADDADAVRQKLLARGIAIQR